MAQIEGMTKNYQRAPWGNHLVRGSSGSEHQRNQREVLCRHKKADL